VSRVSSAIFVVFERARKVRWVRGRIRAEICSCGVERRAMVFQIPSLSATVSHPTQQETDVVIDGNYRCSRALLCRARVRRRWQVSRLKEWLRLASGL
jgi:hypothetical protein